MRCMPAVGCHFFPKENIFKKSKNVQEKVQIG
jgi:hypothetical protein